MKDRGRSSGRQPLGPPGAGRAGRREFGGGDDVGDLIKSHYLCNGFDFPRTREEEGSPGVFELPAQVTRRHSSSRHLVFSVAIC